MGRDPEAEETLRHAWQAGPAVDGGRAMGLALGYPETAVKSFANETTSRDWEQDARAAAFGRFAKSADKTLAASERAIALSWADAIQQASPKIYDQIMKSQG